MLYAMHQQEGLSAAGSDLDSVCWVLNNFTHKPGKHAAEQIPKKIFARAAGKPFITLFAHGNAPKADERSHNRNGLKGVFKLEPAQQCRFDKKSKPHTPV